VVETLAIMERSRSVDPDKLKKVIKTLNLPDLKFPQEMLLARFFDKEVVNLSLHCFIRQSLSGKTVKGLKAQELGPLPPPLPQPDCTHWLCNRAIDDAAARTEEGSCAAGVGACEHVIAVTPSPLPPWPFALARP
jgi:hypothetical protein